MDIQNYFNNMLAENEAMNKASSQNFKKTAGSVLDLTKEKNRGMVFLRPINDECGVPMKTLNYIYEIYEQSPAFNEDGTPKLDKQGNQWIDYKTTVIARPDNYKSRLLSLNGNQVALLNRLWEDLQTYDKYLANGVLKREDTATNMGVKWRKQITLFWAKVLSLTSNSGESLITEKEVRMCLHKSGTFSTNFGKAIQNQSLLDGAGWQEPYFSRTLGNYNNIVSISTVLNAPGQNIGYQTDIRFAKSDNYAYELTEEDIALCVDLNTQIVDITKFDAVELTKLAERVESYIKMANVTNSENLGFAAVQSQPLSGLANQAPQEAVAPQVQVPPAQPQPTQTPMDGGTPTVTTTYQYTNVPQQEPVVHQATMPNQEVHQATMPQQPQTFAQPQTQTYAAPTGFAMPSNNL